MARCLSHDSPEEEKRPRALRSVPRAAPGSCGGCATPWPFQGTGLPPSGQSFPPTAVSPVTTQGAWAAGAP